MKGLLIDAGFIVAGIVLFFIAELLLMLPHWNEVRNLDGWDE